MEHNWDVPFTEEEIEVANIMLELRYPTFLSETHCGFSFPWGSKKKRPSASKQEVAATPLPALYLSLPPSSLPSNTVGSAYETEAPVKKALKPSPDTPLSLFPSETDEKPQPSKKKASVRSLKKKKEQWLEMTEDLTGRNELLKREIENKRLILDQLSAENLELKAKRQKLIQSPPKAGESRLETGKTLNLEKQLTQLSMETGNTIANQNHYQQPFINDQTACKSEVNQNSQQPCASVISRLPSNTGGSSDDNESVSSLGFDLNVPAKEAFEFDPSSSTDVDRVNKSRAAQARLYRRQIYKAKGVNAACKARFF